MRKKILGFMTIAAITASVIAGCGTKGNNMPSDKSSAMEKNMDNMKNSSVSMEKSDNMEKTPMTTENNDSMEKSSMKTENNDDMKKSSMTMENNDDMKDKKMDNKDMTKSEKSSMMRSEDAYDFTLKDLNGNDYKLSDMNGKKVYMKFWASWCSICLAGMEDLNTLAGEDNDFEIITVVTPGKNGEKDTEDFKKWFKELGYKNIKVLFDETGEVSEHYGIRAYPTSVYVNSDGSDTQVKIGHNSNEDIKKTVEELN